jgi:D-alanyl-D-alanine carboxypeptidase (penicillin-binding protein 5/6)
MLVRVLAAQTLFLLAAAMPVAPTPAGEPSLTGQAAVLMDARTGQLLYEKNAFLQMDPASTTKMMTALLVIEHGHLNRLVKISKRADYTTGSSLHIRRDQVYTRMDLLKGLLLRSGNDASVALAESEAGTVERFVAQMNVRAQQLGAFNTAYENTHGLTRPGHYSSAYDLALIARAALKHPLFQQIVRSQELDIMEQTHHKKRRISTTNQLLYGFPGADGVKTGTTNAAGKCVVASATRDGRQLIAVILKSSGRWEDASQLLNWGFSAWQPLRAAQAGAVVTRRPVENAARRVHFVGLEPHQSLWTEVPTEAPAKLWVAAPSALHAPLRTGRRVGFLTVEVPGQPPERVALYPERNVSARPLERAWEWFFHRSQPR